MLAETAAKSGLHGAAVSSAACGGVARLLAGLVAGVWLYHGLVNKLLGVEPRHLLIVQSIPGLAGDKGEAALLLVGGAEVLLGVWVLSGRRPRLCAAVQTAVLLLMNVMELIWAREHLLSPIGLLPVNLLFLLLVWLGATAAARAWAGAGTELSKEVSPWRGRGSTAQTPGDHRATVLPWHLLQRHPLAVEAHFRHCLVLTYALPRAVLEGCLPPGLTLDGQGDMGFLAVALVQTQDLRPAFLPRILGQDFFLSGYRIFVKFRTPEGRTMRGLRILRSDADRRAMVLAGNLLTHYQYRPCQVRCAAGSSLLEISITTPGGAADLEVVAQLDGPEALPTDSPFNDLAVARYYAGPLPYTFDYEPQTHSIIAIKGVRRQWSPRLVPVEVRRLAMLEQMAGPGVARLASAFYTRDVAYRWQRGVRFALPEDRP